MTTVALCRQALGYLVPNPTPNPGNVDYFLMALNQVVDRLVNSGKWQGALMQLAFNPNVQLAGLLGNGVNGFISLPRRYQSVLGSRFGCIPSPVYGTWHQYVESGPGFVNPQWPTPGLLMDAQDGHPTQLPIPPGSVATLKFVITNAMDAGQQIRVFGLDQNGCEIYDNYGQGFNIQTSYPAPATSNQLISAVTGLQLPVSTNPQTYFKGNTQLYYVVNGVSTQIGQYEPTEQSPSYHWYQCGNLNWNNSQPNLSVSVLCQRRFVTLVADTDPVVPSYIPALQQGLIGYNHDIALNHSKADESWAKAIDMLNQITRSDRGGARQDAELNQSNGWRWWGGSLPNAI